jgi:uncharacterized protein YwgA
VKCHLLRCQTTRPSIIIHSSSTAKYSFRVRIYLIIHRVNSSFFNNRLKIQKYVYLSKYYGLDLHYVYDMYLHGPYSRQLASDYYSIAHNHEKYNDKINTHIREQFFELVKDKDIEWLDIEWLDIEWLEAASTLISLHE